MSATEKRTTVSRHSDTVVRIEKQVQEQIGAMMPLLGVQMKFSSKVIPIPPGVNFLIKGWGAVAFHQDAVFNSEDWSMHITTLTSGKNGHQLGCFLSMLDVLDAKCREMDSTGEYTATLPFRVGELVTYSEIEKRQSVIASLFGESAMRRVEYGDEVIGRNFIVIEYPQRDVTYAMVLIDSSDDSGYIYRVISAE